VINRSYRAFGIMASLLGGNGKKWDAIIYAQIFGHQKKL
jgi:hypothetical protein